tara:strand:+ start:16 stop:456 length:441 start_codon:yes stop_codon:yes gene_type:complete
MNLVHYEPWNLFQRFNNEINRVYDTAVVKRDTAKRHWAPAVDVREEAGSYIIEVDVPGVAPGDIEITTDEGALVIKGSRSAEISESTDGYNRLERVQGVFCRRFHLPDGVDESTIEAKSENGVLRVMLPKTEKAEPRRIPVAPTEQ